MPIEIRARLASAPRQAAHSDTLLALRASYYGDSRQFRGAESEWIVRSAREYEELGYDSALVAQSSGWPDVNAVAGWALAATTRFRIATAHRIGLQAPTAGARALATLEQLSAGRVSAHFILGSTDEDQARDGDQLPKAERYRRAHEYLQIVTRYLTSAEPFDYEGEFYTVRDALAGYRPPATRPLISYAGYSPQSIDIAARYADIFAITGETLASTRDLIAAVSSAAAGHGRSITFWHHGPNFILGPTDAAARAKAETLIAELQRARAHAGAPPMRQASVAGKGGAHNTDHQPWAGGNAGSDLQRDIDGDWHDTALYTGIGRRTGYRYPAFVGSPQTVAEALLAYYDLGVRIFGVGLSVDAAEDRELTRELFRLLRAGVAVRETAAA
jgi:alkanesulfonate monooxygenase